MTIASAMKFGPYEIVASLGAGSRQMGDGWPTRMRNPEAMRTAYVHFRTKERDG
jgi:hypothetical protein